MEEGKGDPGAVSHDPVAACAMMLGYRNLSESGVITLAPAIESILRRVIEVCV